MDEKAWELLMNEIGEIKADVKFLLGRHHFNSGKVVGVSLIVSLVISLAGVYFSKH